VSYGTDNANLSNLDADMFYYRHPTQEVVSMKLVDVCGGKMTLREVIREIEYYMLRSPEKLIIKIIRKPGGYYTTLYITEKDFKGGRK